MRLQEVRPHSVVGERKKIDNMITRLDGGLSKLVQAATEVDAMSAAAAAKENAEMQRVPAIACPSQATKRRAPRPKLQPKLPPSKQPRLGGLASAAAAARRPLQTLAVS